MFNFSKQLVQTAQSSPAMARCYHEAGCPSGYFEEKPDAKYFTYTSTAGGSTGTCYQVTGCQNHSGYYEDMPDLKIFTRDEKWYTGWNKHCFFVKGCVDSSKMLSRSSSATCSNPIPSGGYHNYYCVEKASTYEVKVRWYLSSRTSAGAYKYSTLQANCPVTAAPNPGFIKFVSAKNYGGSITYNINKSAQCTSGYQDVIKYGDGNSGGYGIIDATTSTLEFADTTGTTITTGSTGSYFKYNNECRKLSIIQESEITDDSTCKVTTGISTAMTSGNCDSGQPSSYTLYVKTENCGNIKFTVSYYEGSDRKTVSGTSSGTKTWCDGVNSLATNPTVSWSYQ